MYPGSSRWASRHIPAWDWTGNVPGCSTGTGSVFVTTPTFAGPRRGGLTRTLSLPPRDAAFEVFVQADAAMIAARITRQQTANTSRARPGGPPAAGPLGCASGLCVTRASWRHVEVDFIG